ncbi:MAG: LTA synthase family protein, partial [Dysosmobacter sp.]|nr:LTA synthase family protein [Dysosmobacter sp.]
SDTPLYNLLTKSITVSNPYRLSTVFNETGFPFNFCYQFTTYTVDRPEGYSRSAAEGWDQGGQPADPPAVHVVMVMDEAFSDITDEDVFTYGPEDDPLPNLHALRQDGHCLSGHIVVPGFAGGTANTEFDVLTGMQSNALSATTTSAMRVVNRNLDSLIRLFREDGSYTTFFHPGDDWFYNRENVYRWLGAEETVFRDEMENIRFKGGGTWIADDYAAELIERGFQEAVSGGRTFFNYTTTIQNHMSYGLEKYGPDYVFPPLRAGVPLSEQAETLLKVYVEGARDADAMLGRLWRFFSEQDEPVVLVFFGDHLPYLGDNQLAYRELGLDVGPAEDGQMSLRSFETPYVIWANDAAARALDWQSTAAALDLPEDGVISACYLGAVLVELTGRSGESPWFDFLNRLRREAPVVQKNEYVSLDGAAFTEPDPELAADISKWRQWSFYKLQHKEIP